MEKINLTITLDGKKFWSYEGTTKYSEKNGSATRAARTGRIPPSTLR